MSGLDEAADAPDGAAAEPHGRTARVVVEGMTAFDAPPESVWRVAIRPQTLAATMPGVESVEVKDEDHWLAHVRIPLGLVKPRLTLACAIEERREPELARLVARGRGPGLGFLTTTSFELAPAAGGTEMRWRAEVELSGRASAVGEKVLRPLVDRQVTRLMASLRDEIARGVA